MLNRDDSRCTLCNNPATEIHHKTYERVGKEPLSDLTSLCRECHTRHHNPNVDLFEALKDIVASVPVNPDDVPVLKPPDQNLQKQQVTQHQIQEVE